MRALLLLLMAMPACDRPAPPPPLPPATQSLDPNLLAKIDIADGRGDKQLLKGFHDLEQGKWRWSAPTFAVRLAPPRPLLRLRFTLPESEIAQLKRVTLSATLNGIALGSESYDGAGDFTYTRAVDPHLLSGPLQVEFSLANPYKPGGADTRSLGLIVRSIGFELQ